MLEIKDTEEYCKSVIHNQGDNIDIDISIDGLWIVIYYADNCMDSLFFELEDVQKWAEIITSMRLKFEKSKEI